MQFRFLQVTIAITTKKANGSRENLGLNTATVSWKGCDVAMRSKKGTKKEKKEREEHGELR